MNIQKMLININYSRGITINPAYIVIHETDNEDAGADAVANRNYFANHPEAEASTHFVVDDHSIIQCLELNQKGWHVGDNRGHSDITNSNTIGIEICVNSDGDYMKARANATELVKYLISVTGIPASRVVRHYDASGKWCPRRMLDTPTLWTEFKNLVSNGSENVAYSEAPSSGNNIQRAAEYVGGRCKELQEKLIACGYNCGEYGADGSFGSGTYNSLISFQKDNGLATDGLAGPATFAKLNQVIGDKSKPQTSTGYDFKYLQHELNVQTGANLTEDGIVGPCTRAAASKVIVKQGAQGNITRWIQAHVGINADGCFGPATLNAVKMFQRNHGLSDDGIVGSMTWNTLLG